MYRLKTVSLLAVLVLALGLLVSGCGCGATDQEGENGNQIDTIEFTRPDPKEVPGHVAKWADGLAHRKEAGLYYVEGDDITYILVCLGEQPTGGYAVEVTQIEKENCLDGACELTVELEVTEPGEDESVTQALTYPFDLVTVEGTGHDFSLSEMEDSPFGEDFEKFEVSEIRSLASPNIEVEVPRYLQQVGDQLPVVGRARAYGGDIKLSVEDGHHQYASMDLGGDSSEWQDFDVTVDISDAPEGRLFLVINTTSPKSGTTDEQVVIPFDHVKTEK